MRPDRDMLHASIRIEGIVEEGDVVSQGTQYYSKQYRVCCVGVLGIDHLSRTTDIDIAPSA